MNAAEFICITTNAETECQRHNRIPAGYFFGPDAQRCFAEVAKQICLKSDLVNPCIIAPEYNGIPFVLMRINGIALFHIES